MALSNTQIQKARPKAKNYRLYDERGLYFLNGLQHHLVRAWSALKPIALD